MDTRIDFRVTKLEKNLISKLAGKQGMSMSDYIKHQVFCIFSPTWPAILVYLTNPLTR